MEDRGMLGLVKKVVHSLVVSSPGRMTIEKLMRDYRAEEGCNVPYLKLGFNDAEAFLRSIPDTVKVMGHGPMALITAVTTDKSAHIQKLVNGQKKPSARSRNRHKPKYCYASARSDLVFINESARKMSPRYIPPRTYQPPVNYHMPISYPNYNRLLYPGHKPIIVYENINAMICAGQQQTTPRPQPHTFTQKAKPEQWKISNQTQNVSKPEPLKEQKRQPQTISRPQTPVEIKQQNPPQELEKETDKLVEAFKNLSVDASPTGYQDNQEYEIYETDEEKLVKDPFSSEEEEQAPIPVIEIEDSEEEDEAVVLDFEPVSEPKPNPLSTSTKLEVIAKSQAPQQQFYESSDDGDEENAIPAYAVDDRVLGLDYPMDTVRFNFKLPERDIKAIIELEQRIEVQLVKVDNPHNFYFWIYNEEYDDYRALTSNMQMFYESRESEKYIMPLCLITTDHFCVVRHNHSGVWERAKVVRYRPNNTNMTIEVELVDTGHFMCVSHKDVKFLLKEFAVLPAQVLTGRLAFITQLTAPVWSAQAVKFFYNLSSYRRLYAQVEAIKNNTAYLVLIDPDKVPVINLNKSLIDSGWVLRSITA
ncbi:tudor domain-containing protein 5 isoform X2 [Drosophila subpulchrella]|uniref:tudor domain-containing protein 5 isoform X2 n=1 Tax=Drosophila subpulchrella TaxID=1486046 RepID=UPI0018A1A735|nr:tudor domain-containing protein 5 isoform X2 [Drosophila subpulchrella]